MLASHHEKLAESAPAEASSMCPSFCMGSQSLCLASTQVPSTTSTAEKPKSDPVTKKDHLEAAADLMSDIQVETYSSMDKREKTEL